MKIHILAPELVNKIAAGEVVERPVSVVKELVENALDAKATRIEVLLQDGGISLIRVMDNGSGMEQDDALLCLLPHATSKIATIDDLFRLSSFGFRGEALAAIAAVSQFEMVTKTVAAFSGIRVKLSPDYSPVLEPVAANPGTTVTVRNLFFQIPARKKFLKSAPTEYRHIVRYLQQVALMHPNIEWVLSHQDKEILRLQSSRFETRVKAIFGESFFGELLFFDEISGPLKISGAIAKPTFVHSTHKNQYLFVNERPVFDALIARSILEAYETLVPRGYFPAFILKLFIAPDRIDVNVHPRKSEVRFSDLNSVLSVVKSAVRSHLKSSDITPLRSFQPTTPFLGKRGDFFPARAPSSPISFRQQVVSFSQDFSSGIEPLKIPLLNQLGWNVLGQIHQSFLLVETAEGLQVFDQHAVSEIVNYQKLIQERKNGDVSRQQLLIPMPLELSHEELILSLESNELLQRLGWSFDQLSPTNLQIHGIPSILKIEKIEKIFKDVLNELRASRNVECSGREMQILKFEACRSAVMFGDDLSLEEMRSLLSQWLQVENNEACEHGRPAVARILIEEMRKYFNR